MYPVFRGIVGSAGGTGGGSAWPPCPDRAATSSIGLKFRKLGLLSAWRFYKIHTFLGLIKIKVGLQEREGQLRIWRQSEGL